MEIEAIIIAFITVFSLGMFFVSLASYRKHRSNKLLLISLVFFIFLIKSILYNFTLFYEEFAVLSVSFVNIIFDLIFLDDECITVL